MRIRNNKVVFSTWEKYQIAYVERTMGKRLTLALKVHFIAYLTEKLDGKQAT